ncbi:SAM-dependent methyltransferase [Sphingorhabdus lutea]|uniref:SAM-dependent methyltransferase n=1 Tax=Sphingorhabdus lutea TaxID=1913578 RepID=A0A1L3JAT7_9SPHN|nr:class I SAM-dependent methyltransferase [Sphingorhabdus lutea]APG62242.1 SAM-dependent methyltransferase [Sphingorhabdus lutea]
MNGHHEFDAWQPRPANWWDRVMVPKIIGCACAAPQILKARSQIVPNASGDILEIGCGGGINIQFLNPAKINSFTGIDPSPALLEASYRAVQARGIEAKILGGVGEALPFQDDSFDCIIITFTLCSVDNQAQTLREMRRVLRRDGKIIFLEHGRAPDIYVQKWQYRIEPIWKHIAGNCHLTREIGRAYEDAGFQLGDVQGRYLPKTPKFAGWIEGGEVYITDS